MHREDAPLGFTAADSRLIARLSPHVGEGLRRALLVSVADASPEGDGPGVLVLGEDRSLVATAAAGDRWLWELSAPGQPLGALPVAVEAVLARLQAIQLATGPVDLQPRVPLATPRYPPIAELLFQELNATVEFLPTMNAAELRAGLTKASVGIEGEPVYDRGSQAPGR